MAEITVMGFISVSPSLRSCPPSSSFLAFSSPTRRPQFAPSSSRLFRLTVHCSSSSSSSDGGGGRSRGGGDDSFGFYHWNGDSGITVKWVFCADLRLYPNVDLCYLDSGVGVGYGYESKAINWESEEKVTLFTTEGLIQIGGSVVPRRVASSKRSNASQRSHKYWESDYMDPKRQIYLGALFDIAATNGLDMGRRLCLFGYCSSIEMLSDIVEDTVMENGGEVVAAEKASEGGLQEKLTMKVAVPLLWGVPPASETLHLAVRSGGGIIDKVCLQWDYL
ncbi:hypothetical protein Sjap_001383 [Stephania japonica]|uniref:DUF7811 domain-containing protein n=1 Tax=Stephania japonica TaxID=461633 RepID=A0AAP0KLD3_9MAGN